METELCANAPSSWAIRSIEDICQRVTSGGTPSRSVADYYQDGEWPWVKTQELVDGWIDDTEEHITFDAIAHSSAKTLPKNTVLMAMYGATVGQLGILRKPMTCNQACCAMIVDDESADFRYLYYILLLSRPELKSLATGAAQQNLSASTIKSLEIPLPPLPEQRRIAKILGDLDDKIELNRKMNETLEQMARALFKSWFVDFDPVRAKMEGRTPSGMDAATAALFPDRLVDSELGPIPEGWEVGSIYDVAEVVYGAPFASKDFTSDPVGRPLIRIRDLSTENPRVYTSEVHPKGYLVNPGDVVVGMDGEFRAHLWGGPVSWLNQRLCVFAPKETFGTAFIMNSIANPLAEVEATETATTVIHLGKNDIDRFRIVVPASNISSRYALLCQPLFDQIVFNKLQSRTLLTLRDTLLPKLVGGEVRVGEVNLG